MTDVRLTALNPVDSQVYPVACNTSGELLVADDGPDVTVTGELTVDGKVTFNSDLDLSGRLLLGTTTGPSGGDWAQYSKAIFTGSTGSAADAGTISLMRGGTASNNNPLGVVSFSDKNGGEFSYIKCEADGTTGSGDYPGRLMFYTTADGASSPTERLRIDSSGNLSMANISLNASGSATFAGNVTAPNINSLSSLVQELQTKMSLILRQIDISAETP
jgi:hypothetical protein